MSKQFKPSLEKVEKDLNGFSHEIIMYVYHKLNGRDEIAQTYLDTHNEEQTKMKEELEFEEEKKENNIELLEFEEINNIEV